ncbi:MAG: DNA internalization-related competence protein ComEC/Rec2 [Pedobacter sp.]|nr:DNA internalization-related competence protein ComEC/Rec2 [Pedobacter sp.]
MAILVALAAGLLLLPLLPVLPPLWLSPLLALTALLISLVLHRYRRSAQIFLSLAALLTTFSWSVLTAQQALDARLPVQWEGVELRARGVVSALPESVLHGQRFRFRPQELQGPAGEPVAVRGEFQIFSAQPELLRPQALCSMQLRLKRPHGLANPGGFDYEVWLLSEGVTATGTAKSLRCEAPATFSMDGLRWSLRQHFLQSFPESHQAGVLLALITGDRALIAAADWERYVATGVVHLMAISGLHITMLALAAAFLLLQLLRLFPRLALSCPLHRPALLAGFLLALAYSLVAGFSVPTQRTLIMLAVVLLSVCSGRRLPPLIILLLALLAVLLWSPLAVHAAGFWLSFGAVAILLVMGQPRHERPLWQQALLVQLAMSLLLLPLTLWFFERASLVSPLANLLAIPLITFVVVPAGLLGLLAWLFSANSVATFFWQAGMAALSMLDALLEQMQSWPWANMDWSLPGWSSLAFFCLALFCLLQPMQAMWRWLAPVFLLPLFLWRDHLPPEQLRVVVLDVGQGLSVLVQTSEHRLLYDTGPALGPDNDAGRRHVLPALRQLGIHSLDMLLLSHDDNDHTGGAASILQRMRVAEVSGVRPQGLSAPEAVPWRDCRAGRHWQWEGWQFELLYPDAGEWQQVVRDNNRSCVLRVSRGKAAILLPGDLEAQGEGLLLSRLPASALNSPVLVLGHHGSRNASSMDWLAAVQPRLAIVSAGYRNAFRHPSPVLLERLQEAGIPWRNTAAAGALMLTLEEGGKVRVSEFRHEAGRYWQDGETASFF